MLVFFSNYLNHHQSFVADILYEETGHEFTYVSCTPMPVFRKSLGYADYCDCPYLLKAYESEENKQMALELARNADVAIFGAASLRYQIERMKLGKFSFEVSERWLKRGWINLFSPKLLKNMWYYHTMFYNKPLYKLCSSAFAAKDQYLLHSFKNRCYKWGYFTKIDDIIIEQLRVPSDSKVLIMWCARFIRLKHPELPIHLANILKRNGYSFVIDMYGTGELVDTYKELCNKLDVSDVVNFKGNMTNEKIIEAMREHDIFLFTSDKNEGWGAVLNEAMSNGCPVVASDEIGSVPFLIKDGKNGLVFRSKDVNSLYEKVTLLINNNELRNKISAQAYSDMHAKWSPNVAAKNLLQLIDDLRDGRQSTIKEGPCSLALPL